MVTGDPRTTPASIQVASSAAQTVSRSSEGTTDREGTDYGQSIFGSGVCHGPKRWGPNQEKSGPNGGAPKGGGSKGGGPKISRFFPSPTTSFTLLVSHCVFSWFFGGVWKRRGRQMCTFGVLRLSCEPPAAQRAQLRVPVFTKTHQNSTRRDTVREKD